MVSLVGAAGWETAPRPAGVPVGYNRRRGPARGPAGCPASPRCLLSNDPADPVHILGLCGSLRGPDSFTRRLLVLVMAELDALGACTDFFDLAKTELPMCKSTADTDEHPGKRDLVARAERAQGFVLATPEYHNSYSGVLKNALDLLSSEQLGDKMFGLIGIAGGDMGAVNALGHLRIVVRGVNGHVIPQQISLPSVYQQFDGDRLADERTAGRVRDFAAALALHTRRLAATLDNLA